MVLETAPLLQAWNQPNRHERGTFKGAAPDRLSTEAGWRSHRRAEDRRRRRRCCRFVLLRPPATTSTPTLRELFWSRNYALVLAARACMARPSPLVSRPVCEGTNAFKLGWNGLRRGAISETLRCQHGTEVAPRIPQRMRITIKKLSVESLCNQPQPAIWVQMLDATGYAGWTCTTLTSRTPGINIMKLTHSTGNESVLRPFWQAVPVEYPKP